MLCLTKIGSQMKRVLFGIGALALLVFSIGASDASALEAPYYRVGGARLAHGVWNEVNIKAHTNQVLQAGTKTVTCKNWHIGKAPS